MLRVTAPLGRDLFSVEIGAIATIHIRTDEANPRFPIRHVVLERHGLVEALPITFGRRRVAYHKDRKLFPISCQIWLPDYYGTSS